MVQYDFAAFLQRLTGMDRLEAWQLADAESRLAEGAAIAGTRSGGRRQRNYAAEDYRRQLGGLLFFFHHGMKADGLTDTEFALLQPLASSWVARGQYEPGGLSVFGRPPSSGATPA